MSESDKPKDVNDVIADALIPSKPLQVAGIFALMKSDSLSLVQRKMEFEDDKRMVMKDDGPLAIEVFFDRERAQERADYLSTIYAWYNVVRVVELVKGEINFWEDENW